MFNNRSNKKGTVFGCFSPEVMIATFMIEFALAGYVLWRYKLQTWSKLVVALLICLGVFQFAEYQICGDINHITYARIGYIAITLLPALGSSLIHSIGGKSLRSPINIAAWVAAAYFVIAYAFSPIGQGLTPVCAGNYVIFNLDFKYAGYLYYTLYYFGLLIIGITQAYMWSNETKSNSDNALRWMIIGYLVFTVPVFVINIVLPTTIDAIPSIMCGFAVIFALILGFKISPLVGEEKIAIEDLASKKQE
ncbi:hypothetical protein KBF61_01975 [Candidatus Saccharibacteria bacterium]|jgi:hypothetical protein|nr:hypothetical protein [Candidatus Saccharibacteria bacterium]